MTAFLRLAPLDDRGLFMRTLDRPVKAGDPIGLAHLQVPPHAAALASPLAKLMCGPQLLILEALTRRSLRVTRCIV